MDYETRPTSKKELRLYAKAFRVICGFNQTETIDPVLLLDKLPDIKGFEDVHYDIVDDSELDWNVPAQCDLIEDGYLIKIKESVYIGASERGVGGFRMHIMHEIMHPFADKLGFHPIYGRSLSSRKIPSYKSLEWVVKFLAGAVMIPYESSTNLSEVEIIEKYGVSQDAAEYRLGH